MCPRSARLRLLSSSLPVLARRRLHTSVRPPLKLAIIGAGPSGFYTASRILSLIPPSSPEGQNLEIHMYERLPTPYGLVRYGVAPDHPEVKNCQHKFDELAQDSRFKYFGNTLVASHPFSTSSPSPTEKAPSYTYPHALRLSFADIIPYYSTLVLTYGASLSNPLNAVPGSSSSSDPLAGVYPALALVSWYNSHPAYADLPVNLEKIKQVSVVGQGNVALDVARMLLKPVISLAETDLSEEVLNVLSKSSVEKVRVVGRRGPGQVAFTTKEFREMLSIPDVGYAGVDPFLMEYAKENIEKGNGERMRKRLLQLMGTTRDGRKMFELDFLKGPKSFLPSTENARQVSEVEWNLNLLEKRPAIESQPTSIVARSTGETVRTSADMVIESVGYRSEPLTGPGHEWDLPFDIARGRVSNFNGRVTAEEGGFVPGVYAAGWAARGPVGVIATTMNDAYALASTILDDIYAPTSSSPAACMLNSRPYAGIPEKVQNAAKDGKVVVDLAAWAKIDKAEVERAKRMGRTKEREKFRRVEDMLAVLQ
ncbi:ferredoxin-NADP+ reductase [Cryptococcus deuterogattii MMRL2647]|nr:ferredoxin-NADP+ reductase [Cryptococcus deuterogattii MMRL2647]